VRGEAGYRHVDDGEADRRRAISYSATAVATDTLSEATLRRQFRGSFFGSGSLVFITSASRTRKSVFIEFRRVAMTTTKDENRLADGQRAQAKSTLDAPEMVTHTASAMCCFPPS
jgi:hypothetical protein